MGGNQDARNLGAANRTDNAAQSRNDNLDLRPATSRRRPLERLGGASPRRSPGSFAPAALLLALLALPACAHDPSRHRPGDPAAPCAPGRQAPTFYLPNVNPSVPATGPVVLTDLLADPATRLVAVAFFSSACAPCREELTALQRLHETAAGLRVVGVVALDDEDPDRLARYVADLGLTFPVAFDPAWVGAVRDRYLLGQDVIPATFVADRQGRIVECALGVAPDLPARILTRLREARP